MGFMPSLASIDIGYYDFAERGGGDADVGLDLPEVAGGCSN